MPCGLPLRRASLTRHHRDNCVEIGYPNSATLYLGNVWLILVLVPMANHDGDRAANPKILLAEDDPGVRRALQMQLLGFGYDVRSYASSIALLADASARDAVCLIADYRMPGLDGLALLRALRESGWMGRA